MGLLVLENGNMVTGRGVLEMDYMGLNHGSPVSGVESGLGGVT